MSAAAIVVAGEGWHPGVVGHRGLAPGRAPPPAVRGDRAGRRVRPRLGPQHRAPTTCTPGSRPAPTHLLRFGGHRMAAGLEIEADRDPATSAPRWPRMPASGWRRPTSRASSGSTRSCPAARSRWTWPRSSSALGPFGAGNPAPALLVPGRADRARDRDGRGARARPLLAGERRRARARRRVPHLAAGAGRRRSASRTTWPWASSATAGTATVEARVVLRSLCPTRAGRGAATCGPSDFWDDFDARAARPTRAAGGRGRAPRPPSAARPPRRGRRRRGRRPAHQRRAGAARGADVERRRAVARGGGGGARAGGPAR